MKELSAGAGVGAGGCGVFPVPSRSQAASRSPSGHSATACQLNTWARPSERVQRIPHHLPVGRSQGSLMSRNTNLTPKRQCSSQLMMPGGRNDGLQQGEGGQEGHGFLENTSQYNP